MSKRTRGKPIAFRLETADEPAFRTAVLVANVKPAVYVARLVAAAVRPAPPAPPPPPPPPEASSSIRSSSSRVGLSPDATLEGAAAWLVELVEQLPEDANKKLKASHLTCLRRAAEDLKAHVSGVPSRELLDALVDLRVVALDLEDLERAKHTVEHGIEVVKRRTEKPAQRSARCIYCACGKHEACVGVAECACAETHGAKIEQKAPAAEQHPAEVEQPAGALCKCGWPEGHIPTVTDPDGAMVPCRGTPLPSEASEPDEDPAAASMTPAKASRSKAKASRSTAPAQVTLGGDKPLPSTPQTKRPSGFNWFAVCDLGARAKLKDLHEGANSPANVWGTIERIRPFSFSKTRRADLYAHFPDAGTNNVDLALQWMLEHGEVEHVEGKPRSAGETFQRAVNSVTAPAPEAPPAAPSDDGWVRVEREQGTGPAHTVRAGSGYSSAVCGLVLVNGAFRYADAKTRECANCARMRTSETARGERWPGVDVPQAERDTVLKACAEYATAGQIAKTTGFACPHVELILKSMKPGQIGASRYSGAPWRYRAVQAPLPPPAPPVRELAPDPGAIHLARDLRPRERDALLRLEREAPGPVPEPVLKVLRKNLLIGQSGRNGVVTDLGRKVIDALELTPAELLARAPLMALAISRNLSLIMQRAADGVRLLTRDEAATPAAYLRKIYAELESQSGMSGAILVVARRFVEDLATKIEAAPAPAPPPEKPWGDRPRRDGR